MIKFRKSTLKRDSKTTQTDSSVDPVLYPELFMCQLCRQILLDATTLSCGHSFCRICVVGYLEYRKQSNYLLPACPKANCSKIKTHSYHSRNNKLNRAIEFYHIDLLNERQKQLSAFDKLRIERYESSQRSSNVPQPRRLSEKFLRIFTSRLSISTTFIILLFIWSHCYFHPFSLSRFLGYTFSKSVNFFAYSFYAVKEIFTFWSLSALHDCSFFINSTFRQLIDTFSFFQETCLRLNYRFISFQYYSLVFFISIMYNALIAVVLFVFNASFYFVSSAYYILQTILHYIFSCIVSNLLQLINYCTLKMYTLLILRNPIVRIVTSVFEPIDSTTRFIFLFVYSQLIELFYHIYMFILAMLVVSITCAIVIWFSRYKIQEFCSRQFSAFAADTFDKLPLVGTIRKWRNIKKTALPNKLIRQ